MHICQRWQRLIFASASYLGICLVCTYSTPVADMLARLPVLPLIVDYADEACGLTVESEEGLWFALLPQCRDRIHRIRLLIHQPYLWTFVVALFDGNFPRLEHLFVKLQERSNTSSSLSLRLPDTFRAPCLRHLVLTHFGFLLMSPILATSVYLVTLSVKVQWT